MLIVINVMMIKIVLLTYIQCWSTLESSVLTSCLLLQLATAYLSPVNVPWECSLSLCRDQLLPRTDHTQVSGSEQVLMYNMHVHIHLVCLIMCSYIYVYTYVNLLMYIRLQLHTLYVLLRNCQEYNQQIITTHVRCPE